MTPEAIGYQACTACKLLRPVAALEGGVCRSPGCAAPIAHGIDEAVARAVDSIVADISDRRGLKREWHAIDEDVQTEIRAQWFGIIKLAMRGT